MQVQREQHLNKTHPPYILVRCDELFRTVPLFIQNLHQIAGQDSQNAQERGSQLAYMTQ